MAYASLTGATVSLATAQQVVYEQQKPVSKRERNLPSIELDDK